MSVRLHLARQGVREGLRSAGLAAPLDALVDEALREGLAYLVTQTPARTSRFVVTEEALTDGTLLDVRMLLPDLRQLIVIWRTDSMFRALEYTPSDEGAVVLFSVRDAPRVGDVLEATYRPALTVAGFDGAASTSLPEAWQEVWVRAGIYYFLLGELTRLALGQGAPGQGAPQKRESLVLAQRLAKVEMEHALASLRTPVRPASWNRGL